MILAPVRNANNNVQPAGRPLDIQPAGIKTITEFFEIDKRKRKERASKLEESWRLMQECIGYLEKNEPWKQARSSNRN
jgi:hypothetical protein